MPVCPSRSVLHVLDASLNADLGRHGVNSRRIECRSQADRLGILGYTLVDHSVKGLAPPLVCGNVEPWNCRGVVLHLRSLLRKSHAVHQVGQPFVRASNWCPDTGSGAAPWAAAVCAEQGNEKESGTQDKLCIVMYLLM